MFGIPRARLGLVLLLCTALLAVRTVGDHLHLCFDGAETTVALHGVDGEFGHELPFATGGHHDVDVDLFHATLAKSTVDSPTLPGPPRASLTSPLAVVLIGWVPQPDDTLPNSPPRYFQPPLRGPPSTTLS